MMERPDPMFRPLWMKRQEGLRPRPIIAPLLAWLAAIAMLIFGLAWCSSRAEAQVRFDCRSLADTIGFFADLRDVRGGLELTIALARRRNADKGEMENAALEREIRLMWKEGKSREDAMLAVYRRCVGQLGDMGAGT